MLSQDDLKQIGGIVRDEIKAEVEPIKSDLQEVRQGQARLETIVEAVKAGQDDLRDHMDAGFMDLRADIKQTARDNKRLIEELEEQVNITTHTKINPLFPSFGNDLTLTVLPFK